MHVLACAAGCVQLNVRCEGDGYAAPAVLTTVPAHTHNACTPPLAALAQVLVLCQPSNRAWIAQLGGPQLPGRRGGGQWGGGGRRCARHVRPPPGQDAPPLPRPGGRAAARAAQVPARPLMPRRHLLLASRWSWRGGRGEGRGSWTRRMHLERSWAAAPAPGPQGPRPECASALHRYKGSARTCNTTRPRPFTPRRGRAAWPPALPGQSARRRRRRCSQTRRPPPPPQSPRPPCSCSW